MVTTGTYQKERLFNTEEKLNLLLDSIFRLLNDFEFNLQAWSVLQNHYHIIFLSHKKAPNMKNMIQKLHGYTARELNRSDNVSGRKVWFQYWDMFLTFENSFYARLKYVHYNPVHHGIVKRASDYKWCSAAWFERKAEPAFFKMINNLKIDKVSVPDDF